MASVGMVKVVSHAGAFFPSVFADGEEVGVDNGFGSNYSCTEVVVETVGNGPRNGFPSGDGGVAWKTNSGEPKSVISISEKSTPPPKESMKSDSPEAATLFKSALVSGFGDGVGSDDDVDEAGVLSTVAAG